MFQHFIIVASSYTEGKRVGFHMTAPEGKLDNDEIRSILDRLKEIKRDDVGIHLHLMIVRGKAYLSLIHSLKM